MTWLAVVTGIVVVGTFGYVLLFGWSLNDAIYMTVITLTTEGYREGREWLVAHYRFCPR